MTRTSDLPVYAVLAAAGAGRRMGLTHNKVFWPLEGLPVVVRTARVFQQHKRVAGWVVVAAAEECSAMQTLLQNQGLTRCLAVVPGGASRQASVHLGLEALQDHVQPPAESPVLVHDAARCLVTGAVIDRVIAGVESLGACGAAVPAKDTVKRVDSQGRVLDTPDRSGLWLMQTPQGAHWHLLWQAYQQAHQARLQATDDLSVLAWAGQPTHVVMGSYANLKLTTPEDLVLARALLEAGAAD